MALQENKSGNGGMGIAYRWKAGNGVENSYPSCKCIRGENLFKI